MLDKNKEITIEKVKRIVGNYDRYKYMLLDEIQVKILRTDEEFFSVPNENLKWEDIKSGSFWGGDHGYAWFKGEYTIPEKFNGEELYIKSGLSESEGLLFINNKPVGLFDYNPEVSTPSTRLHIIQPLSLNAHTGEKFDIAIEAYAGHMLYGCMPFETSENSCDNPYPRQFDRRFCGLYVCKIDNTFYSFALEMRSLIQMYEKLPEQNYTKWRISNIFEEIYNVLPQIPNNYSLDECRQKVTKSREIIAPILNDKFADGNHNNQLGYYGLIGHSHLDTAWRWPVKETIHKAARTFSNALSLMDQYPEYTFIQSTVLYIDWMKKYYPDIYVGIVKRTKEGRWEPNGGTWVECDGNMVGGEYLIRQFLRGQRYLQKNLGFRADLFWQPDTFGYSPAIPQIMQGCGMKYFLTTKLSWNEANHFPYDTFIWRGIDGSEVLTHFNLTHCWPDAETMLSDHIGQKDVSESKLLSYGYGDGGGGPSADMIETSRMLNDLKCMPYSEHTTVSKFMNRLEKTAHNLPVYDGELYLELHRGTLTQMHEIKKTNRKAEFAIHNLEVINVHRNIVDKTEKSDSCADMLDTLMLNQFHDILPGTSLAEVHDLAIKQNSEVIDNANKQAVSLLITEKDEFISVYNALSWDWNRQIVIDDNGKIPLEHVWQKYTDINGNKKIAIGNICIKPFSAVNIKMTDIKDNVGKSVFERNGNMLTTPFAKITFSSGGGIESFIDKECDRQVVLSKNTPLNTFYIGEDVPLIWDNWDINYDQKFKMSPVTDIIDEAVASDGQLQYRIRRIYKISSNSTLKQDMVLYSDSPRIDFETVVDWNDPHTLLKVSFPVDIRAQYARFETQFGHVMRANNENISVEKSKFEVCNHKWTDLSENRYGVAILNDCKYGISVDGNDMRLTLHKGGCHPDPRGDIGIHSFVYSMLPHNGGFKADTVIHNAYELNNEPIVGYGKTALINSMFTINQPNVIIETVKFAEDKDGYIVRIYESECAHTNCELKIGFAYKSVFEINMLEEYQKELSTTDGKLSFKIKPFEIKTFKICTL